MITDVNRTEAETTPVNSSVRTDEETSTKERAMKMISMLSLIGSVVVLVIAIVLSLINTNIIAGPNGWLDLSLLLAVLAIAFKYVHDGKE